MISYFSDVPMSPSTPMDLGFFNKRLPVRRALQELGPNDPKLNLRIAETLLTISAEQFLSKWNFDPINMKPVTGKFLWTPVKSREEETNTRSASLKKYTTPVSKKSCVRIPSVLDVPVESNKLSEEAKKRLSPEGHNECSSSTAVSRPTTSIFLPECVTKTPSKVQLSKSSRTPKTPKSTQRKITEFGCQRKRLYSKSEDDTPETSPRKKLHIETPSKISMTIV